MDNLSRNVSDKVIQKTDQTFGKHMSSLGSIPHSISNELLSVPQSTIEQYGLLNPYLT